MWPDRTARAFSGCHRRVKAARRKFDDGLHLVAVQPLVPRQDVVDIAPASRFSKIVATGMRVLQSTHAPLTLSGMLSTAGDVTPYLVPGAILRR